MCRAWYSVWWECLKRYLHSYNPNPFDGSRPSLSVFKNEEVNLLLWTSCCHGFIALWCFIPVPSLWLFLKHFTGLYVVSQICTVDFSDKVYFLDLPYLICYLWIRKCGNLGCIMLFWFSLFFRKSLDTLLNLFNNHWIESSVKEGNITFWVLSTVLHL